MLRTAQNFLGLIRTTDPERWYPLLTVYYVTYACRFACPYCSDGSGTPYPKLREPVLEPPRVAELLATVRRYCDNLVLTGGEPLQHPRLAEILRSVAGLSFDSVILTTNGDGLGGLADIVNESVHHLVFSLDSLIPERADANFGVGAGTLTRILHQIELAAARPKRRYDIVISSVVTPGGINDLYAVYEYCRERGFLFAACPQLVGTVAHAALSENDEYQRFFDFLVREKKRGRRINGTVEYLEHMRDLSRFECVPSATLAISPSGQVFYPCLERGTKAGSLLEVPDLHLLRQRARATLGPEPACGAQCHSACALSFSLLLKHPWSTVREGYLQARSRLEL